MVVAVPPRHTGFATATAAAGAGDLSANNVLLQKTSEVADPRAFVAKVSDLGLARLLPAGQQQMVTEQLGTLQYMPKEMLQEGRLTPACDVFR